jgi:hypothetical protein
LNIGFLPLPVDPISKTMTHPLRSTGITPLQHYYEAVRPSPAHQYFRPRGWSRLRLVWGFRSQAEIYHLHLFLSFVPSLCSTGAIIPSIPTRASPTSARTSRQSWPSHTNLATCSAFATTP